MISAAELGRRAVTAGLVTQAQLEWLWGQLGAEDASLEEFVRQAVGGRLLTHFQADGLKRGKLDGWFCGEFKLLYLWRLEPLARVYRAEHTGTGRLAAVKVLRARYSDDQAVRRDFFREAAARQAFCDVSVSQSDEATPWYAVDFVEDEYEQAWSRKVPRWQRN